ncbi:hypothetical protein GQ607_001978 [Colletotrichum asianum]|uniref:Secreted protein n=1 Tax=Colletotrichum asianum TaxID=702518 RepID=A0A8H3WPC3_9PEZI|nr:hypothetical protein GQ607_001978 [Colletotrichum asianum]
MLSMFLCILRLLAEFATVHKIAGYDDADRDRCRLVSLRVAGSAGAIVTIASNVPRSSAEAAVAATVWFTMRARPRLSVTGAQAEDASCDTCKIIDTTRALSPLPFPVCSSPCRWRGGELHTRLVLSTESFRVLGFQSPLCFQGLAYDRPT